MDALDHRCLNEVEGLTNPTAENIAVWIWGRLKPGLRQISAVGPLLERDFKKLLPPNP
jgi:6-pyruvoyltetrahydropterin/6-carboxytetrahydropterin synthase